MQTIRRLKVRDQVSEQIKQYVVERRREDGYLVWRPAETAMADVPAMQQAADAQ